MTDWKLVPNPAWAGVEPVQLTGSECHDRSHFVTVQCACGEQMHMHQTQWQHAGDQAIGSRCHGCGELMLFEPGFFDRSLDAMRDRGWIA
jgi:hypothetical protein